MNVISVDSNHGHRFIGTDQEEHESCLTCGAMFELLANGSHGRYVGALGEQASECSGNTGQSHGHIGEAEDDALDPDCNCLFCR